MTRRIGIIGMGHVGSTIAHCIVHNGYADDLVLIDKNKDKLIADALDFRDAQANLDYHTNIYVNDYSALGDADIVICSIGHIKAQLDPKHYGDRFVEFRLNIPEVKDAAKKVKEAGFHGVVIVITNPCDVMTTIFQRYSEFPKHKVIGTGTMLDSARMKRAVDEAFHVDPRSVSGYNMGEHGNSQFSAWSTIKVKDQPVVEMAEAYHFPIKKVEQSVRVGGYTVFAGKHYTNYAIASAACKLINIVMNDARTEVPVSNYRYKYDTYMSYPIILGRNGLIEQVHIDLTDSEQQKLADSAKFIQDKVNHIKEYVDE
ncbi:L-lactate dehydrogenase [Philodulcilactobacillus myokoensis]|uniref:L-lactate dehydrogenase n=1 Tax=Philodulcilactobacillus myokoensis TaxID=2929573 RepID=A0A9W6ET89_9LACO|nr:L-lactate dehydrogenase [Philodulcilactobacillus myokoensis]GLB47540.1 L-lactate dehydrogenase [Philodulcilactobacillus myokoensis]